jgi:hypothetical protein
MLASWRYAIAFMKRRGERENVGRTNREDGRTMIARGGGRGGEKKKGKIVIIIYLAEIDILESISNPMSQMYPYYLYSPFFAPRPFFSPLLTITFSSLPLSSIISSCPFRIC